MSALGFSGMYGQRQAAATRPAQMRPKVPGTLPAPPRFGMGAMRPQGLTMLPRPPQGLLPGRLQAPAGFGRFGQQGGQAFPAQRSAMPMPTGRTPAPPGAVPFAGRVPSHGEGIANYIRNGGNPLFTAFM